MHYTRTLKIKLINYDSWITYPIKSVEQGAALINLFLSNPEQPWWILKGQIIRKDQVVCIDIYPGGHDE